jgi:hypothetical protein
MFLAIIKRKRTRPLSSAQLFMNVIQKNAKQLVTILLSISLEYWVSAPKLGLDRVRSEDRCSTARAPSIVKEASERRCQQVGPRSCFPFEVSIQEITNEWLTGK